MASLMAGLVRQSLNQMQIPFVLGILFACAALFVPAHSNVTVNFVTGSANISLTNDTFTGRTTRIALTSDNDSFELALIQDGFGRDRRFQYCWMEVRDTATETNMTWRAPCNPEKVDKCAIILTDDGDLRLKVSADGSPAFAAFLSGTGGEGVVDALLTTDGDLLLVKSDNTSVWKSSDHIQRQQKCKEEFSPSNGCHRTRFLFLPLLYSLFISSAGLLFLT